MWSSIAVLVGLGGVALGFPWADAAAALVVALFVCLAGWRLGRRTIETLTDTAPAGSAADGDPAAADACAAWSRSSACGCGRSGDKLFVEVVVAVSRTLPLDRVEALKREVAEAIRADLPRAEVGRRRSRRARSTARRCRSASW